MLELTSSKVELTDEELDALFDFSDDEDSNTSKLVVQELPRSPGRN